MFTFSHVTSIGISQDEYNRRLALGETNLVKGEAKWYREISTDVNVPETVAEFASLVKDNNVLSEKIKCGEKTLTVSEAIKHYIVGLKLAVNQKVQAANRDGNDGPSNGDVVAAVIRFAQAKGDMTLFGRACGALASQKTVKAFASAWMADHPDFDASAK